MEIAMNKVLPLDPGYQEKLQGIAGRVIAISFTDLDVQLYFLPNDTQFTILTSYEGDADVKLSGTSWDFFHMGVNQQSSTTPPVIDSNIHFEGNVAIGQKFAQLFSELNIDWEEALADIMGDIFAHRATNAARQAGSWLKDIFNSTQDNLSEYIQEEVRLTPAKIEIENFYDDLADLRADTDRILARFQSIKDKLSS